MATEIVGKRRQIAMSPGILFVNKLDNTDVEENVNLENVENQGTGKITNPIRSDVPDVKRGGFTSNSQKISQSKNQEVENQEAKFGRRSHAVGEKTRFVFFCWHVAVKQVGKGRN